MSIKDRFLLGETREGFYIPAQIKQAWNAQLKILKEIDRVCTQHGLEYFAGWGTMLGALRHGGYIPWDDDMDIVMKREDYTRFLELVPTAMPEGYHVQTYKNQDDYWLFMGKVVARNNICFEPDHLKEFAGFPYIACVDIFVLDYVHPDEDKEQKRREDLTFALGVADGIVEGQYFGNKKRELLNMLSTRTGINVSSTMDPVATGRAIYAKIEERFAEVSEKEATHMAQLFPWGLKSPRAYMPKEIFRESIRVPFEDMMIRVPLAFDYFASKCYGNYWIVRKDGGAHEYPFFEGQKENLKKILDFDLPEYRFDEEAFLRNGSRKNEEGSYKELLTECLDGIKNYSDVILNRDADSSLLEETQQLAIDMGTMIEQVKGEGTKTVSELEKFCELVFETGTLRLNGQSVSDDLRNRLQICLNYVSHYYKEEILDKRDIVFVSVMADEWGSIKDIYDDKISDPRNDVYIVVIPYFQKDYDGSAKEIFYEGDAFPAELNIRDYRSFPLELMHPEEIYVQNGFDGENPIISVSMDYYSDRLLDMTDRLILVPSIEQADFTMEDGREYKNMRYYVEVPGVINADEIILRSEQMKAMYLERLSSFCGEKYRRTWENRIKVISTYKDRYNHTRGTGKKTVLYVTSAGRLYDKTVDAAGKTLKSLKIFRDNVEDINVKWFIYPAERSYEISTETPFHKLMRDNSDILVSTEDGETGRELYTRLADECDAYYGDVCPVMRLMSVQGKPVMIMNYEV